METMMPNREFWNRAIWDWVSQTDWEDVDARLGLPDDDELLRMAGMIDAMMVNRDQESQHFRRPEHRQNGLYAERAFCRVFGVRMNSRINRYGSGRVNAVLTDGTKVDVVGRAIRRNGQLPDLTWRLSGNRFLADVCVLVFWIGRCCEPVFLGWIDSARVKTVGDIVHYQNMPKAYAVPPERLLPMHLLMQRHNPRHPLADPASDNGPIGADDVQPMPAAAQDESPQPVLL
jgi:hypothetical protein